MFNLNHECKIFKIFLKTKLIKFSLKIDKSKLTKLLIMDPIKRITSQAAMDDQYFKDDPKPTDE
jgi:hypothetical protein